MLKPEVANNQVKRRGKVRGGGEEKTKKSKRKWRVLQTEKNGIIVCSDPQKQESKCWSEKRRRMMKLSIHGQGSEQPAGREARWTARSKLNTPKLGF